MCNFVRHFLCITNLDYMKRFLIQAIITLIVSLVAGAVPAKPGFVKVMQSDGTMLQIQTLGDEFCHSLATVDGLAIAQSADGDYYYVSAGRLSNVLAHDTDCRSVAEQEFIASHEVQFSTRLLNDGPRRARSAAPRRAISQVPTMGSPRVPIILIEYSDKKMSHNMADFETQYKTGQKSVLQYFTDQSNGKYTPQYDLYGIYALDSTRATYGQNVGQLDKGAALMVNHSIEKAGDDIDWSLYDNDGDGLVDVCIVVYAGVGESQASRTVPSSVWPCQWDLTEAFEYYNDGYGPVTRNGVTIDKFAVFNEIEGSNDYGTTLDGIGTFCHEFSHCLGLPDFYSTNYRYVGMSEWSLMDKGCYNGGRVSGDTPIGYSAYEKAYMGWIDLITPVENTHYTLPVFNSKSEETDQALKLTSPLNENEYFILENRRQQGWDLYIPDQGVMISHFTYIPSRWDNNSPNDEAIQLATIMAADNSFNSYTLENDLFGRTNHSFTDDTKPAALLNMKASGTLASRTGGAGKLSQSVTGIELNADGTASLWYMKIGLTPGDVTGDDAVDVEDVNAIINIILELKSASDYPGDADINGDGKVDVSDVNEEINIILQ